MQQRNESFNKIEIKTTEVGEGDGKCKPHVLRGKTPWKGTGISVVQCEKNLLNSNTNASSKQQSKTTDNSQLKSCDPTPSAYSN